MIDNEDVFDALADRRRRQLLVELVTHNPQHVPELSGSVQEFVEADEGLLQECLSGSPEIPGRDEELLRLHHVHLPKLADYGFIGWNRDAHIITKGPQFDEIRPVLELLIDQQEDEPVVLIRQ